MTRLQKAEFFYWFWQESYNRTLLPCAFNQMMRYFNRIAELKGL